jgi:hypothetical protein
MNLVIMMMVDRRRLDRMDDAKYREDGGKMKRKETTELRSGEIWVTGRGLWDTVEWVPRVSIKV